MSHENTFQNFPKLCFFSSSVSCNKSMEEEKIEDHEQVLEGGIWSSCSVVGKSGGGSFVERRAAKFGSGFNAPRINTPRFRTTSPLVSPAARSPRLTIPPGISPTALLDSPLMLPNTQGLPSPTTGTFCIPLNDQSSIRNSLLLEDEYKGSPVDGSSFGLKPPDEHSFTPGFSGSQNQDVLDIDYQDLISKQPPVDFEFSVQCQEATVINSGGDSYTDINNFNNVIINTTTKPDEVQAHILNQASNQTSLPNESIQAEDNEPHHHQPDQSLYPASLGLTRNSEDGYNWRKYGQKQVKGSEYPRSYYKCTHQNCQVKKKVERSPDGQITEIIYKGAHNHAKPHPCRGAPFGSTFLSDQASEVGEGSRTYVKAEGGPFWMSIQSDLRGDGLERGTPSASVVTDVSDPLSTAQGKSVGLFGLVQTPELSSTVASHEDDDDDGATQGSVSFSDDADDVESESKRRRMETCLIETNLVSRSIREPRVVVQIETEIDILDDGYRWRKYGQKIVKGNPNPRSYYKCTSPGCLVRKHVERAPHDLKFVITTYEGKHNHEVPAARNSNQINSSGNGDNAPSAVSCQSSVTLPRSFTIPLPDQSHLPDPTTYFKRKPEFSDEYLRSGFIGSFSNDMKMGTPFMFQMKLPSLQSTQSYGSFGINSGSLAPGIWDFPVSLPSNHLPMRNYSAAGYNFNSGISMAQMQPSMPVQQMREMNEVRYLKPKQEQNDDSVYDACSSTVGYQQIMGKFP